MPTVRLSIFILLSCLVGLSETTALNIVKMVAQQQDELTADIQELMEIQTNEEVISKLEEVENTMLEATLNLYEGDNSGKTLAAQTEVIEKIYEAAKKKQQGQGENDKKQKEKKPNQAMMDMLEEMLGKKKEGKEKPSQAGGTKPGTSSKKAQNSSELSETQGAEGNENKSLPERFQRTVPKVSGNIELLIPSEYQALIEEYNETK